MRVRLAWLALGLVSTIAAALGGTAAVFLASLPDYDGEVRIDGLEASVTILRDAHAVPTIRARSEHDAYLALGFVHAQDRLWQLELQRRIGQGRLAELVGASALPVDRFLRTLGLYRVAEAALQGYPVDARALLEAYAAGVNAFLAQARVLPPEFQILWHRPEPWRAADSVVIHRLMALEVAGAWRRELLRSRLAARLTPEQIDDLFPPQPDAPVTLGAVEEPSARPRDGLAPLFRDLPAGFGSNLFVLSGSRTASGAPLLANDPHLPARMPGIWYLATLETPGFQVSGGTIPGLPPVVIGRNRDVAWGLTTTGADTEDLVRLRVDPADPDRHLSPSGSEPFGIREELIAVRGGDVQRLRVRTTRYGPVLSDLVPAAAASAPAGEVLALSWTGLDVVDHTLAAGFAMARAADAEALTQALRLFASPVQNVGFADRKGRIGLMAAGRIPIRAIGDGRLPVNGSLGEAGWRGHIPFTALPRTQDPPDGLIVNANNRLVGADYPYLVTADWEDPARARRLLELLGPRRGVDAAAARAVQQDLVSGLARDLLPMLREARPAETRSREVLGAMAAWDGTMDAGRPEPLIFTAWASALAPLLWGDELGPEASAYGGLRPEVLRRILTERTAWCDDVATAPVESCAERTGAALDRSLSALEARLGTDWRAWRWGSEHPARMPHRPFGEVPLLDRLFSVTVPIGGDGTSVAVAGFPAADPGGPFPASHLPGLRLVADLAAQGLFAITATGQSGHPLSPHYRDLTAIWASGRELRLEPDVVALAPPHRLCLVPTEDGRD